VKDYEHVCGTCNGSGWYSRNELCVECHQRLRDEPKFEAPEVGHARTVEAALRGLLSAASSVTRCDSCSNLATHYHIATPSICVCDGCLGTDERVRSCWALTPWAAAVRTARAAVGGGGG
jgi:hypothetical protein